MRFPLPATAPTLEFPNTLETLREEAAQAGKHFPNVKPVFDDAETLTQLVVKITEFIDGRQHGFNTSKVMIRLSVRRLRDIRSYALNKLEIIERESAKLHRVDDAEIGEEQH